MNVPAAHIAVVDDEPNIRRLLEGVLGDEGFVTHGAGDLDGLRELVATARVDLVLLDVCLPGADGMSWLQTRGDVDAESLPVIMMSGHGSIELALDALRLGAVDFLEKPLSAERVLVSVRNALRLARLNDENRTLRNATSVTSRLVGESSGMQALRETLARVARTEATVLITGENGTGKELAARAVHEGSDRRTGAFVRVNCAAIPRDLLESELFGHEKGAFSGATRRRRGHFERAQGGTLLLDEIGELPFELQPKLLRVLEERELLRVGGETPVGLDVRVLASTNRDLPAEVSAGRFREDLFYRLNVVPVSLPSLRDHLEDLDLLVDHFAADLVREHGRLGWTVDESARGRLAAHDWPGNVRELRNTLERLVILSAEDVVRAEEVDRLLGAAPRSAPRSSSATGTLGEILERTERETLEAALQACGGNLAEAGRRLGVDRANLHRKLKRLGIERST